MMRKRTIQTEAGLNKRFVGRLLRFGKRDLVCVLLVHLFVSFTCVSFCPFSFPLGVGGWLRFVIVALPGLFSPFNRSESRSDDIGVPEGFNHDMTKPTK